MSDNSDQSEWTFDKWADSYDTDVESGDECFQRYDEILAAVVEVAKIGPGSQVLDIGVGTGNLAMRCAELNAEVIGLDPYKGMLAKAEAKLADHPTVKLAFSENPFLSLLCEDASFDAIISTFAFHHVLHEEKPAAIRELKRALKPGGVIAIGDLMFENAQAGALALQEFEWLDDEYHTRIDELGRMFDTCRMELTCQQFTPVSWVVHATKPKNS